MAQIKQALSIELPIFKGEQAIITLIQNVKATTSVKNILGVSYNQQYIFITIESKNSIYKDIPVQVNPAPNFFDGQIITKGQTVCTEYGTYITVAEITEVTKDGIRIIDSNGKEYIGDIHAV